MTSYDSLDDGKTHPHPFVFTHAVEPLEDSEEFVIIVHIKTGTIIFHTKDTLFLLNVPTDFNNGFFSIFCVFDRIR